MDSDVRKWVLIGIIGAGLFFMSGVLLALVINRNSESPVENQQLVEQSLQGAEEQAQLLMELEPVARPDDLYWLGEIKGLNAFTGVIEPTSNNVFYYPEKFEQPDINKDKPEFIVYTTDPDDSGSMKLARQSWRQAEKLNRPSLNTNQGKAVLVAPNQLMLFAKQGPVNIVFNQNPTKKKALETVNKLQFSAG